MNYPFETGRMYRIEGIDAIMDAHGKGYKLWVFNCEGIVLQLTPFNSALTMAHGLKRIDPGTFKPGATDRDFVEGFLAEGAIVFSESQYNHLAGGVVEDPYEVIKVGPPPTDHCVLCGRSLDLCRCIDFDNKC